MEYDIYKKRRLLRERMVTCGYIWRVKLMNGEYEDKVHVHHRCVRGPKHINDHRCSCNSRLSK